MLGRRRWRVVALMVALIVASAGTIIASRAKEDRLSSRERSVLHTLTQDAHAIVEAEPTGEMAGVAARPGSAATTYATVAVIRKLKGDVADSLIIIEQQGFFRDSESVPVGQPLIKSKQRYLLFLQHQSTTQRWKIVSGGYFQFRDGKYRRQSGNRQLPLALDADELRAVASMR